MSIANITVDCLPFYSQKEVSLIFKIYFMKRSYKRVFSLKNSKLFYTAFSKNDSFKKEKK